MNDTARRATERTERMRLRILRILASVAVLVPMAVVNAPAASADENIAVLFTGTATFTAGGLCSPIAPLDSGDPSGINNKPLDPGDPVNGVPPHNCDLLIGAAFDFNSTTCAGAHVSDPDKKQPGAGVCVFNGNGAATGWCGLSRGSVNGIINIAGKPYAFDLSWTGDVGGKTAGGTLILLGTLTNPNGNSGPAKAVVQATPDPTPANGSCTDLNDNNKETVFIFAGTAEATISNS